MRGLRIISAILFARGANTRVGRYDSRGCQFAPILVPLTNNRNLRRNAEIVLNIIIERGPLTQNMQMPREKNHGEAERGAARRRGQADGKCYFSDKPISVYR